MVSAGWVHGSCVGCGRPRVRARSSWRSGTAACPVGDVTHPRQRDRQLSEIHDLLARRQPTADRAPVLSPGRLRTDHAGGRVVSTPTSTLWNVLLDAYARLGFDPLQRGVPSDGVRASHRADLGADTVQVLVEIGAPAPGLRTLFRALVRCQEQGR